MIGFWPWMVMGHGFGWVKLGIGGGEFQLGLRMGWVVSGGFWLGSWVLLWLLWLLVLG